MSYGQEFVSQKGVNDGAQKDDRGGQVEGRFDNAVLQDGPDIVHGGVIVAFQAGGEIHFRAVVVAGGLTKPGQSG